MSESNDWGCKVLKAPTTPDGPQDCNWPFCGCDPYADKFLEAIEEAGLTIVPIEPGKNRVKQGAGHLEYLDIAFPEGLAKEVYKAMINASD